MHDNGQPHCTCCWSIDCRAICSEVRKTHQHLNPSSDEGHEQPSCLAILKKRGTGQSGPKFAAGGARHTDLPVHTPTNGGAEVTVRTVRARVVAETVIYGQVWRIYIWTGFEPCCRGCPEHARADSMPVARPPSGVSRLSPPSAAPSARCRAGRPDRRAAQQKPYREHNSVDTNGSPLEAKAMSKPLSRRRIGTRSSNWSGIFTLDQVRNAPCLVIFTGHHLRRPTASPLLLFREPSPRSGSTRPCNSGGRP